MVKSIRTTSGIRYIEDSKDHTPDGLRRWQLADYPGYVYLQNRGARLFVPYCTECELASLTDAAASFTPAIERLEQHMIAHELARVAHASVTIEVAGAPRVFRPGDTVTLRIDKTLSKENTMRKRADIEAEAKQLERRLSSLVDELAHIDSLPAEPTDGNGTVVTFDVRFHPGDRTFSYAAIRAANAWFLTGREKSGRSWEELLEFMSQDHRVQEGEPIMFEVFVAGTGRSVTQVKPGL